MKAENFSSQVPFASIEGMEFPHKTLVDCLGFRASESPTNVVFRFLADGEGPDSSLTFGDLDKRARAVSASLRAMNATGERVLLLFPPGLAYIVSFFGCLYAGAIAVPLCPPQGSRRRNKERCLFVARDAEASFALTM